MLGLILAAGAGSRINQLPGDHKCKPTIRVNGKSLIEYSVNNLRTMDIDRAVVVVGKYKNEIKAVLGEEYGGVKIEYCIQEKPIGLMNAVMSAYEKIKGETVVLQLSDELFIDCKAAQMKEYFTESGADFLCTYTYEENREIIKNNYSLRCDAAGTIEDCIEKPLTVDNNMKGTGMCVFSPECIELLGKNYDKDANFPNDLCDLMKLLVRSGKKGKTFCIAGQELNINTIQELERAEKLYAKDDNRFFGEAL